MVETYREDKFLKDGILELAEVQPVLYGTDACRIIGKPFARTFSISKELITPEKGAK